MSAKSSSPAQDRIFAGLALAAGLVILVVLAGVALFLVLRAKDLVGTPAGDFTGGDGFIGYIRPLVAGTLI
ncbi:phosphate ABC transporter permease subunit PstC, partial [Staphylococcus sp. EG-SA-29]|nr:phosphate ABC transporter permease subunit PstC [Staphylococcus sp. EG-SA-29]